MFESNFENKGHCPFGVSWLSVPIQTEQQPVSVFQWFFLDPTQRANLYYFRRVYTMWFLRHLFCRHDLFTFQKFWAIHFQFLASSHDNRSFFTSYFVILKVFCMPLFGHFQFWLPTRFLEVNCSRFDPAFIKERRVK